MSRSHIIFRRHFELNHPNTLPFICALGENRPHCDATSTMQQPLPFNRDAGRKTTATIECSKSMVGRVIGKNGDTIKALQNYTGSLIQVNQVDDPCQITISGTQQSLSLAMSMVADIVRGTFKGFALLRQLAGPPLHQQHALPRPIYAPGYGLIPSTQVRNRVVMS